MVKKDIKKIKYIYIYMYNNLLSCRNSLYKDIKGESGIYLWINNKSGKSYLGSSKDLKRRLRDYFSQYYLKNETMKNNSLIYKALLKYGYKEFQLKIIELCPIELLIEREQYYLDNYILEYNILLKKKSLLGFKHSELTKKKMSETRRGKKLQRNPLYINPQSIGLIIENIETGGKTCLPSIRKAAKYINVNHAYLAKCLSKKGYYKNNNFLLQNLI